MSSAGSQAVANGTPYKIFQLLLPLIIMVAGWIVKFALVDSATINLYETDLPRWFTTTYLQSAWITLIITTAVIASGAIFTKKKSGGSGAFYFWTPFFSLLICVVCVSATKNLGITNPWFTIYIPDIASTAGLLMVNAGETF